MLEIVCSKWFVQNDSRKIYYNMNNNEDADVAIIKFKRI